MNAAELRHPDTVLVDALTAWLNTQSDPSGGDAIAEMCRLIAASGRPLLSEVWDVEADVTEDRYGLVTATVSAGPYTIRVRQPTDENADLRIDVSTDDGDDFGLAITVDGRPVLDPMTCTWTSNVPADLQLTRETRR